MKTIEILINSSGQITINATGFQGADCEKATAFLEQELGILAARQRKPEWFQRNHRTNRQKVGV
jgi:hypothetical protein